MPQIVITAILQLEGRMKYEGFSAQGLKMMDDAVHGAIAMDAEGHQERENTSLWHKHLPGLA
jgi:hypothetical protein